MRFQSALVRSLPIALLFTFALIANSPATESPDNPIILPLDNPVGNQSINEAMSPPGPCSAPNTGGTVSPLPAACPYRSYLDSAHIINGLPPGSQIDIEIVALNLVSMSEVPGGPLGGTTVNASGSMTMVLHGSGVYAGYLRNVTMSTVNVLYYTAPRTPGTSPQSFAADLAGLQGQLPPGDPDFDLLRITAGGTFGMPSPGHTTLVRMDATSWAVNSFFDITYRMDFIGSPGGPFAGMSGSTTDFPLRLLQGGPFWKPGDDHKMHYPQLPDSNGWDVYAVAPHMMGDDWQCSETGPVKDIHFWGSWFNDDTSLVQSFTVSIWSDVPAGTDLPWSHPGSKLWENTFPNYIATRMDNKIQGYYAPNIPFFVFANHQMWWQYDILIDSLHWFSQINGTIYWLVIQANLDPVDTLLGRRWGWKNSPTNFNDDAAYRGVIGTTCTTPENGAGTGKLPALCPIDGYGSKMFIIDGLPPGSTIEMPTRMDNYSSTGEVPGGMLGGNVQFFDVFVDLPMTGTGGLSGYSRFIQIPTHIEMHSAPRGGATIQDFAHELAQMQGQITGDPDFDLLRITGGTLFGMPSPGHTTLALQPTLDWTVNSFFDITYRIDFVGHPGGPLGGMSGSTTGTIRMYIGTTTDPNWTDIHYPLSTTSMDLAFVITGGNTSCCIGFTGNVNKSVSENPDLSDLSLLIAYLTVTPRPPLPCLPEANVNAVGVNPDLSDLSLLIAYLTVVPRPPLPLCP